MAAEFRTNECRSLRNVIVLLKPYLKDEFSYRPEVEKKKKSKSRTIIFFEFFFKIFSKVWSGNNKVPQIWTKNDHFFLSTGRQRVALPQGGKDLEKLNFFI